MENSDMNLDFEPVNETVSFEEQTTECASSIIKVMGVGGGGGNAAKHMYDRGIEGVDFMIANTDAQALAKSPIPIKIQLGKSGLGAGANPEVGRDEAMDSESEVQRALQGTKMLFVTAGMGGGTGTGASPVVASLAKEMGILTVGIVTYPFDFEGESKFRAADEGIAELRQNVDALIVIKNELLKSYYPDLTLSNAFAKSDDVLLVAAKSIAELITIHGNMNVDFNDVKTILKDSGTAIIGAGIASGENRAREAAEAAIASPLLEQQSIYGAEKGLLFIAYHPDTEITMDELTDITDCVGEATCNLREKLIWGHGKDENLKEGEIRVILIATGFHNQAPEKTPTKQVGGKKADGDIEVTPVAAENSTFEEPEIEIPAEAEVRNELPHVTVTPAEKGSRWQRGNSGLDNDRLRSMQGADMDNYLSHPAYKRRQDVSDGYECSAYRVGAYGIQQDPSAYLKSKESID